MLRQIATVFATRLTTLVKAGDDESEPDVADSNEGSTPWSDEEPKKSKKQPNKKDAADWWKNGDAPPF